MVVSDDMEEIVEKKPSHPVSTALLIVSAISLFIGFYLALSELTGFYMTPDTVNLIRQEKSAVQAFKQEFPETPR